MGTIVREALLRFHSSGANATGESLVPSWAASAETADLLN